MAWRPVDLDPLVLVMVGKPARGKTFTARRVARYLAWLGYKTRVFNVGAYRRERLGAGQPASFFDPDNDDGRTAREAMAREAVDDLVAWIAAGGEVAILDATNGRRDRRAWVAQAIRSAGARVLFVALESDDPAVVERNVRETKVHSPDYVDRPPEEAVADFMQRIEAYDRGWEPLEEGEGDQIRLIGSGRRIVVQGIHGHLAGRLTTFLLHLHHRRRHVYLSRHGQSRFNLQQRIGGDAPLSEAGEAYAGRLAQWVAAGEQRPADDVVVWTSTLQRTRQTAAGLGRPTRAWRLLDEIDAGICDGLTYTQVEEAMPREFEARRADKFSYRYPQGESYQDVIDRLDPVVLELERQPRPLLIIGHQAVLRVLLGYLTGVHPQRIPHLEVPLHTVIRVTPDAYGTGEARLPLGPDLTASAPPRP